MKWPLRIVVCCVGFAVAWAVPVSATVPPPEPVAPLIAVPAGCAGPEPATVIFEGALLAKDARTGRFQVMQVRAGSAAGFAVSGLIDIRLGGDVRFLQEGQHYIVGAAPLGPNLPLGSNIREPRLTFGGNAVIELDEASLECPTLEDPLQVLHLDGTPIETGVLTGLTKAKTKLARAVLVPALTAFAILVGLVLIRWFFTAIFKIGVNAVTLADAAEEPPVNSVDEPRDDSSQPAETASAAR